MEKLLPQLKDIDRRELDQESVEQIDQWIKDIPELEELEKLREHYLIKRLIDSFTTKIVSLENVLRSKRSYGPALIEAEVARLTIFETIDMYKRFINFFAVEAKIKSMKDGLENIK
jgi:hypothetical protein